MLAVASVGAFMTFVDSTIVNVAFPSIIRSFHGTSLSTLSWVLNAYNLVFAAFLVTAGRLADLLGRKRMFGFGIVVFTLASALCAAAGSVEMLIAARVLQAAAAAILVPASLALVLEAFPASERAHAVGLWTVSAALAAGLGPSLGGILVNASSWRLAFLVNVPVGAVAVLVAGRTLIESRAPGRRVMPDLTGAMVLALAIAALTVGIVKGSDWGWGSVPVLVSYALAAALTVVFVRRSQRHVSPVIDLALLRVRGFAVANSLTIIASAGYFAYLLCNVLFLTTVWRYSVLQAGLAITPAPLAAAVVAGPLGKLADRHDYRYVLFPGALIWAAGLFVYIETLGVHPQFVSHWLPGQILLGVGAAATLPVLSSAAVAATPGGRFATTAAVNSSARQLGAVLGIAILVAIIGKPSPGAVKAAFDHGWTFAACLVAAAAVGSLALGRIRSAQPEAPDDRADGAERRALIRAQRRARRLRARPAQKQPSHASGMADVLAEAEIFAELSAPMREALAEHATLEYVRGGEWLFRAGDPGDSFYLVRSGRLQVVALDGKTVIYILGRGGVLGELALLTSSPRSASVRAYRDSQLVRIAASEFTALFEESPAFALALTRVLATKLQANQGPLSELPPATTIAVVGVTAGRSPLPARELGAALVEEIGCDATVACLHPGSDGADAAAREELFEDAERTSDRVVLIASEPPGTDEWTDFCLRQADRVIALTAGGELSSELEARHALRGCDLVACGEAADAQALAPWFDSLTPRALHRLSDGELGRLSVEAAARRVAGRSVGVVCSGGGARAFAQIGVLEELIAAGVIVDRVAGCSMGAFIAAMFAAGMEPDEIDAHCHDNWVRRKLLNDYTLSRRSIIRGEKVRSMLAQVLGTGEIEELPRDFFCISSDLQTGELVVHRRGVLWEAVGASMCLPGLAEPMRINGRLLVDGGVLNNLPVGTMAATAEGPVIAIDVTSSFGARAEEEPPRFGETISRTLLLGSTDTVAAAQRHADLVIAPDCEGAGLLEFHQLDRMREAGRKAARAVLETEAAGILFA